MKTEMIMVERQQARRALSEGEQRFQRLLTAITDYIYTVQLHCGTVQSTTHEPGCEGVTGYTSAQFSADPYLWYRIVHEDDRELVLLQAEKILAGNGQSQPLEHRIFHKDGSIRWIRNTCIPHLNDHGVLTSYDGLIKDITTETVAKQKLEESEERLKLIIEGSTDGVWDWDVRTGKTFFSPRWKNMLGYEDHELSNDFETWKGLVHPDDRDYAMKQLEQSFSNKGAVYALEHRLRHKDGSYRWILARGVVLRNARGDPVRMAGSHVDITDRKQTLQELERTNRKLLTREKALKRIVKRLKALNQNLKEARRQLIQAAKLESIGTLAAGVAHEVKNPLQTIIMGLDYLDNVIETPDRDLADVLGDMRGAADRADKIVRGLLTISTNGEFSCVREDVNRIVEQALWLCRGTLAKTRIQVVRDLTSALPDVCVDSDKIKQVFINLILNALQAMPTGGILTVRTNLVHRGEAPGLPIIRDMASSSDDLVIVEVQDTGCGIDAHDLPRVFDPFYTKRPSGKGSGLGLPVAKRIVESHHGAIEIANVSPGGVLARVILRAVNETDGLELQE